MPHDIKGNQINPGDSVILRGTVESVQPGEEYCNCTIKVPAMHPRTGTDMLTINTRQVELVKFAAGDDETLP